MIDTFLRLFERSETEEEFLARAYGTYINPAIRKAKNLVIQLGGKPLDAKLVGSFLKKKMPKDIDIAIRVADVRPLLGARTPGAFDFTHAGFVVDIFLFDGVRWAASHSVSLNHGEIRLITPDRRLASAWKKSPAQP